MKYLFVDYNDNNEKTIVVERNNKKDIIMSFLTHLVESEEGVIDLVEQFIEDNLDIDIISIDDVKII